MKETYCMTVGNNHPLPLPAEHMQRKKICKGIKSEIRLPVSYAHTKMAMDVLIIMHDLTVL